MMNQVRKISLVVVMSALALGNVSASAHAVGPAEAKVVAAEIAELAQGAPENANIGHYILEQIRAKKNRAKAEAKDQPFQDQALVESASVDITESKGQQAVKKSTAKKIKINSGSRSKKFGVLALLMLLSSGAVYGLMPQHNLCVVPHYPIAIPQACKTAEGFLSGNHLNQEQRMNVTKWFSDQSIADEKREQRATEKRERKEWLEAFDQKQEAKRLLAHEISFNQTVAENEAQVLKDAQEREAAESAENQAVAQRNAVMVAQDRSYKTILFGGILGGCMAFVSALWRS